MIQTELDANYNNISFHFEKCRMVNDIIEYCNVNNISDIGKFLYGCLLNGFNIERYGYSPCDNIKRQNGETDVSSNDEANEEKKVIKKKKKIIINNED